ncbi:Fc.00g006030.m01.CDS01 [Cosmosporella sp. VM-42]
MPSSPSNSPLPAAPALHDDDAQLPKGQCRYILTLPELKGQRCGCMGFDHNKSIPGATCQCGHLSCYHVASADAPSPGKNKAEIDAVKERVQQLEDHMLQGEHDRFCSVVSRVSELEETVDKNRDEAVAEIKGSYRNICAAWQLVEQLQKRMKNLEELYQAQTDRMSKTNKEVEELRNRQLELLDSDEILEERIEKLESAELLLSPPQDADTGESSLVNTCQVPTFTINEQYRPLTSALTAVVQHPPLSSPSSGWTVHISLMPSKVQPFPFEKDTVAYKRCLSRGLHRMVAVEGTDAESFHTAVSKAFQSLLQGRPWMPLQAKLCDAETLQGLPMLRLLEPRLIQERYDMDFLREHCAVCTPNGKMDSLYITMVHDTLSWNFLKRSPVYLEGLESAWEHDIYLDQKDGQDSHHTNDGYGGNDEGSPSAGDIVAPFTSLKRSVSEVSCSSALDDSESARKMARTCKTGLIEIRRGVETAR